MAEYGKNDLEVKKAVKIKMKLLLIITVLSLFTLVPSNFPKNIPTLAAVNKEALTQQIDQFISNEEDLKGALAGISIRSQATGEILYDHFGDIRLRPASNMKLLSAAAALSILGKDYRFSTELLTDGVIKKGSLKGNLYLKGKGDPTLIQVDFEKLAIKMKQQGVRVIRGDLIGDDTWYDDERYSIDLTWSDEQTYYGAQVSALTASPDQDYDTGTVIVEVIPGKEIGAKAMVEITPNTNYLSIINEVVTGSPDGAKKITIEREHGENEVIVRGTIPMKAPPEKEWIAVWEPTGYAVALLKQALAKNGIKVTGKQKYGATPTDAKLLLSKKSIPLTELLPPFMKLSNNGHAEILVKEMGKVMQGEGSWDKGIEVMKTELEKMGVNIEAMVIRDGSGISHVNLIPANELSKLLYSIQNHSWFPEYVNSLPVAGKGERMVGGSLRNRMKTAPLTGNVKAKTGTIATVSSLSGYVETQGGEKLIFSILLNNLLDEAKGKMIEDKLVKILGKQ